MNDCVIPIDETPTQEGHLSSASSLYIHLSVTCYPVYDDIPDQL